MRARAKGFDLRLTCVLLAFVGAAIGAIALAPHNLVEATPRRLTETIPKSFLNWREIADTPQQVSLFAVDENGRNPMDEAYDDSLLRTYADTSGARMMLAIAYDRVQREEDRVHRPEICYVAQGFSILSDEPVSFKFAGGFPVIQGRRMLTRHGNRFEAVSYWIRTGNSFSQNPWRSRGYVLAEGLAGRLHDGILVRISEIIRSPSDAASSFDRQDAFAGTLIREVDATTGILLARRTSRVDGL